MFKLIFVYTREETESHSTGATMKTDQNLKIDLELLTEEIINNKIYPRPKNFDYSNVRPNGLYTLGLIQNNSRFVTIDEQVRRATEFAQFILQKSNEDQWKNKTINICVVGSGLAGISCVLKLLEEDHNHKIKIKLLEKRHMLCPIQRNCLIRKVYPHLHKWPNIDLESLEPVQIIDGLEIISGIAVGDFAAQCVQKLIQQSGYDNRVQILQDVSYLHISKLSEESNDLNIHASGKLLEQHGSMRPDSINEVFDVCILATGFGVETNHSDFKSANLISYWRNDDRSQVPLYSKNSTYIISGFGDGALSDLFRLKIYDYDALRFLKEIEKFFNKKMTPELMSQSLKINEWENESFDVFEQLELFFKEHMDPQKLKNLASWIRDDNSTILHIRRSEATPLTVGFHQDSATQAIKRILNNQNSIIYNRFIFYVLWKLHGLRIELTDSLDELVNLYKVPEENVLVRHGTDKLSVVRDILSPSLFSITAQLMNKPAKKEETINLKVAG